MVLYLRNHSLAGRFVGVFKARPHGCWGTRTDSSSLRGRGGPSAEPDVSLGRHVGHDTVDGFCGSDPIGTPPTAAPGHRGTAEGSVPKGPTALPASAVRPAA